MRKVLLILLLTIQSLSVSASTSLLDYLPVKNSKVKIQPWITSDFQFLYMRVVRKIRYDQTLKDAFLLDLSNGTSHSLSLGLSIEESELDELREYFAKTGLDFETHSKMTDLKIIEKGDHSYNLSIKETPMLSDGIVINVIDNTVMLSKNIQLSNPVSFEDSPLYGSVTGLSFKDPNAFGRTEFVFMKSKKDPTSCILFYENRLLGGDEIFSNNEMITVFYTCDRS